MNHTRLYILAPVLAVVIPTLIFSTYIGISGGWVWFFLFLVLGTLFAGFLFLVLAFPIYLVFWCLGIANVWTSIATGFVIGCILLVFLGSLEVALLGGALGGWIFWLVLRRATEDTLTKPPPAESTP